MRIIKVLLETFHFAYFAKYNCLFKYEKLKCNGICRSFIDYRLDSTLLLGVVFCYVVKRVKGCISYC